MKKSGLRLEPQSLKFIREFKTQDKRILQGARIALYNIGKANVFYTRNIIKRGPKTGVLYRIPGRKRRHRASAPGEAPANLTGKLRRGVNFQVKGNDQMEFGDTELYGKFLEMGTRKMARRPHLEPAVKANQRYAEQELGLQPLRELQR